MAYQASHTGRLVGFDQHGVEIPPTQRDLDRATREGRSWPWAIHEDRGDGHAVCGRPFPHQTHIEHWGMEVRLVPEGPGTVDCGGCERVQSKSRYGDATPLRREIAEATEQIRQAQARQHEAVRAARAHGLPWSLIGEDLGVSAQSAHERFASTVPAVLPNLKV
jgi:hypothetical protein